MVSQLASSLRGTRARIHVWIPSVSVLFVVALCLCTLVASIRDDSIGLLLMPIACALVCAGCRMRRLINTWMRRLMNTRGGSTGSRPTSPASLQARQDAKWHGEGLGRLSDAKIGEYVRRLYGLTSYKPSKPTLPVPPRSHAEWEGTSERRDREKCQKTVSRSQDLQDLSTRKIAQLPQQRMQVLRCQEFGQSFFACRVGVHGRENRPLHGV